MSDFAIRPYADSDAQAVADLFNDVDRHVGAYPWLTVNTLDEWSSTWSDRDANTRLVIGPDGAPVAFGVVECPPEGGHRVDASGAVAPAWRGRGLGRDLMAWQLERADLFHAAAAPEREWIVSADANADDSSAFRLFERFGMSLRRRFLAMEAVIADAPEVAPLDRLRVTSAEQVDAKALYEAHMTAFQDHFGFQRRPFEEWSLSAVDSVDFRADLSRIAYDGDAIASYVLCYQEAAPERAYIGQVGTRRESRGAGIASALLGDVLRASGEAGKDVVRLDVDADSLTGAVGIYERVGFALVSEVLAYAAALPTGARPA